MRKIDSCTFKWRKLHSLFTRRNDYSLNSIIFKDFIFKSSERGDSKI